MIGSNTGHAPRAGDALTAERLRLAFLGARWFLIVYVPFTLLQIVSFLWIDDGTILSPVGAAISIAMNLTMLAAAFGVIYVYRRARTAPNVWQPRVYPALVGMTCVILFGWIVHMQLAGTHSSTLAFLVPATIIVFTWFFRARDSVVLFLAAHALMGAVIVLEHAGVLPYAPLFRRGREIGEYFLNWQTVGMNVLIYVVALAIIVVIMQRLRRSLEEHAREMAEANRVLREEVEERKRSEREKAAAIRQLEEALAQVKRLKGLLPVCASCKKVRSDDGYWHAVDEYLADHTDVSVTHGLCPDCAAAAAAHDADPDD